MAPRRNPILRPTEATWGERFHLAYRKARAELNNGRDPKTGEAAFSYRVVADKLRSVGIEVADQTLMRLEELEEEPARMRQRQVAYFALIAYGYDPADFGLTGDNVVLTGFDIPKIKRVLTPSFRWSSRPHAA